MGSSVSSVATAISPCCRVVAVLGFNQLLDQCGRHHGRSGCGICASRSEDRGQGIRGPARRSAQLSGPWEYLLPGIGHTTRTQRAVEIKFCRGSTLVLLMRASVAASSEGDWTRSGKLTWMPLSRFAAVTVSYFTSVASRALLIFNTTPAFLSATSLTWYSAAVPSTCAISEGVSL